MLKGKRGISTCSLSSCRIRAEALARAFNTRIWPCVWIPQRLSAERSDGMSNGIDDDEEFFDASPSPVEAEDESLYCEQHSSAATEAGRAKLYELLQQHASDDAIDVYYDVSEGASLPNTADDMCLKGNESVAEESVPPKSENNEKSSELMSFNANQSNDSENKNEVSDELKCCDHYDDSQHASYSAFSCDSNCINDDKNNCMKDNCECVNLENVKKIDRIVLSDDKIEVILGECQTNDGKEHLCNLKESECYVIENKEKKTEAETAEKTQSVLNYKIENTNENTKSSDDDNTNENSTNKTETLSNDDGLDIGRNSQMPSALSCCENESTYESSKYLNFEEIQLDESRKESNKCGTLGDNEENKVVIEIAETESLSPASDTSEIKILSPLENRLHIFDECRPKISRTTSLKTGKTPPGTPSRKKIVRFADVLGLDLEDVRHIMTGDIPIIPSSAYTDLDLKDADLPPCEPTSETVEIKSRQAGSWKALQGATATNVLYPTFSNPGEQPDFLERVRNQGICLETVVVSEMSVQCTCKVMNYGFHKKVIARYTFNDWLSTNDIEASYIQGSSNGEMDNFAFSIFLSPFNSSLKFALKHVVNGKEYWDNNGSQNYCFSYHGNEQLHVSSSSWQYEFW